MNRSGRPGRRGVVREVDVDRALELTRAGAVLIDVREPYELAIGRPRGALHVPCGEVETQVPRLVPDRSRPVLLICAAGVRSRIAAETLARLGYEEVASVAGGFDAWRAARLPVEGPDGLTAEQRERYARQIVIPEVGSEGQARLLRSKVLVVGAGGLGSPAALYLAAAGVGTIGIVDDDVVERGNLHRQVIHNEERLGTPKVDSAAKTLAALNPSVRIEGYAERLTPENVERILSRYEVVVDGSDNFATRYLVNDACVRLGIPDVQGAIHRFQGQVGVFWPGHGPCYRCLFPEPPPPGTAPPCAEAGVLGVLPGVIGSIQGVEAIKLLLGIGRPLVGRILLYDALAARFTELEVHRDPECRLCAEGRPFPGYGGASSCCGSSR